MSAWKDLLAVLPFVIGVLGSSLSFSAIPNLLIQKACSPHIQPSINDFICNDTDIIAQVSEIVTTKSTIKSACSALSTALFGYWRDSTGLSKPLVLIGAVAEILAASGYILAAMDWGSSVWLPAVFEAVVSGLYGEGIIMLGANCIVIAKAAPEVRTIKIQIFTTAILVSALISSSVSGYLLTYVGYRWLFLTVILSHLLGLLTVLVFVEEAQVDPKDRRLVGTLDQFRSAFRARPNLMVIWLMLTSCALVGTVWPGEGSLGLYYYQQRFHMTFREVALYGTFQFMVGIVGSFVMALLITKVFKWSDFKFGIVASFLSAIGSVCTALANTRLLLLLCAPLGIMKMNLSSIQQSVLSKCVKNDELGLFLGLGSIPGFVLPFGINYLYNYTFSKTSKVMPGAFYFVSAGCYLLIMILISISCCLYTPPQSMEVQDCNESAADSINDTDNLIDEQEQSDDFVR